MTILYLCDRKKDCIHCSDGLCNHTGDIDHAVNFKKDPDGNYWENAILDNPEGGSDLDVGVVSETLTLGIDIPEGKDIPSISVGRVRGGTIEIINLIQDEEAKKMYTTLTKRRGDQVTFLDLLAKGIDIAISRDITFYEDAISFTFRKDGKRYVRIVEKRELVDFNFRSVNEAAYLENMICHEAMDQLGCR